MNNHTLTKTEQGFQCSTCFLKWNSEPVTECVGCRVYGYNQVPANLVTLTELNRRGLKPGGPPRGAYFRSPSALRKYKNLPEVLYFYDCEEAIPKRTPTPKQRIATETMRQALRQKFTCKRCGYYDRAHGTSKYYPFIDGLCSTCFDILAWKFDCIDIEYEMYDLLTTGKPLMDADIYPELMYNLCDARGTDLFNVGYAVGWVEALLEDRSLFGVVPEMAQ